MNCYIYYKDERMKEFKPLTPDYGFANTLTHAAIVDSDDPKIIKFIDDTIEDNMMDSETFITMELRACDTKKVVYRKSTPNIKEAKRILKNKGYKLIKESIRTKKIFTDEAQYGDARLIPVKNYEELKKLYSKNETIAVYANDEWYGEVYSFDRWDEENPGNIWDFRESVKDQYWEEYYKIKETIAKENDIDDEDDIDELAMDSDEFDKLCRQVFKDDKCVVVEGNSYGQAGNKHGYAVEAWDNFKFYCVEDY